VALVCCSCHTYNLRVHLMPHAAATTAAAVTIAASAAVVTTAVLQCEWWHPDVQWLVVHTSRWGHVQLAQHCMNIIIQHSSILLLHCTSCSVACAVSEQRLADQVAERALGAVSSLYLRWQHATALRRRGQSLSTTSSGDGWAYCLHLHCMFSAPACCTCRGT
jgi:hypothetical protein